MEQLQPVILTLFQGDLLTFLKLVGYIGIYFIVFAESGLLFGFIFPGDSLLFTAGFLASQNIFDITLLAVGCFIAAVVGDQVGYMTGHNFGKKLFHKEDSLFFHKKYLVKARDFYEKHGKKTIVIARFLPVVRTFAPIVAGMGDMHYPTFLFFNILGGLLWALGLSVTGYLLGNTIPDVDKYLLPIIGAIIVLSFLPTLLHILKDKALRTHLFTSVRKIVAPKKA